jgi:hypothetical protein
MVNLMVIESKHVALYVPALNRGGAERVAALLASGFFKAGWRVTLLVDYEASENRALVDPGVPIRVLGSSHGRSVLSLVRFLRSQKPDVVLAIGGLRTSSSHLPVCSQADGRESFFPTTDGRTSGAAGSAICPTRWRHGLRAARMRSSVYPMDCSITFATTGTRRPTN